jgi:uncharacterized membrane protein YraQ (UPF0718 family)
MPFHEMKPSKTESGSWISGKGWFFLFVVIVLYALIGHTDINLAQKTAATFFGILEKIYPVLGLVFILIFISHLVLSPKKIRRTVGAESGLKGWVLAIFTGILSTGPIYVWYALLADLRRQGMKKSLMAVFLYNRAVKLPLLPLLIHYFSVTYTVVLSVYLVFFSVVTGLLMERLEHAGALAADDVSRPLAGGE